MPFATWMLARAFEADPQVRWFHPRARSRARRLRVSFESSYRMAWHLSNGVDVAVDEGHRIVGSALWIATPHVPARRSLTLDEWLRMRRVYGSRTRLVTEGTHQIWTSHVQEPHWHLLALGTAPEVRGHGYGEALMRSGLARCHADGLPAHLETSNPENIPYYERFGFEVTGMVDPPGGWPRNWLMRYDPPRG